MIKLVDISTLFKDPSNPRKPDNARLSLLRLSIAKLGFLMPVYATQSGMLLSGHQRLTVATQLGLTAIPVSYVDIKEKDISGVNIVFNRATNDFSAFDTGNNTKDKLNIEAVIEAAEALPDWEGEEWFALDCKILPIKDIGLLDGDRYDKKSVVQVTTLQKMGIRIPIVVSESGKVVNGVHRLFAAKEAGIKEWPVVTIPDNYAEVALNFLNYLSMDFHVDEDFARLMRYSAYRRPQNNRGHVPKAYRFWANGGRTLLDRDSYSTSYWRNFRDIHGDSIIDFGAGLGKVAPFIRNKGMDCIDFEPYRIDPNKEVGVPDPDYSKKEAKRFLDEIADGRKFTSIFLASVMNSVPFPEDRMAVLAIVHALSDKDTGIYLTFRDISDFNYEYGGIRQASYFVFDTEPSVRVGDVMRNPKIQKFHTQEEADNMLKRLWTKRDFYPGGNVFYARATSPVGVNPKVLRQALWMEFELLPYAPCASHPNGSTMGLGDYAVAAFSKRLGISL